MTAVVGPTRRPPGTDPALVDVPAVLRRCRALVDPALRAAVARLDPTTGAQAGYHLGWTGRDGAPAPGGGAGGKALRPALALLTARACGADERVAVPGGVAVELVHNFSLLHDDLIDGDTERRHRATVWALWGAPSAILTGDALLALAQEVLLDGAGDAAGDGTASSSTRRGSPEAALLLSRTVRELVGGQVADVAFADRDDVGVDECLAMAHGKTGTLLGTSTEIGAVLAAAPAPARAALRTFGAELGLAFQLIDDLLGIWGDPAVTGKPVLADLRERKKSLPVTWAVVHGGDAGHELAAWLARPDDPDTGPDDELVLRRGAALVEAGGGRAWAGAEARRRLAAAEAALATLDEHLPATDAPTHRARAELVALGRHLADREA
ncbi:polyprenyl synthetase family protein [Actinomycetospora cinnamomea]|uniref:Geranylgeranyl diphosphate synthase type I n=1 Tax=Actinomycetospora cinnamomea TaxID=663609 RepID=A0A2U1F8R5_9PSEU|nr:polyprenyl synthetase family protein [Actinomycetospora cinnamomea]PVZ08587.1 geranylgeranyl diphosphate synthase type I [Actinomycetospora cinnamomea]